jgi:hypothetical protein
MTRAHCRTSEEIVKLLTADLRLTTAYLHHHPKVYWIWNHRKWCLESVPLGPGESEGWRNECWKMELMLIEKMLDVDARNCESSLRSNNLPSGPTFSSCLGLQAIRPQVPAGDIQTRQVPTR